MDTENTPQVASSLDIAARNSMALPIIMRDINVMKQGILKLVKIAGGTQRDKADRFFLSSSEREKSYESQMSSKRSTTPTKVGEKKDGKGFFGQANDFLNSIIAGGLTNMLIKGGLIAGILYGIGKFFTSAEFRASVSNMIGNFGRTVFGEEGWKDVKTNIALGAGLLLTGIIAVKASLIYLSQSIAAAAWGIGGGLGVPGKNRKPPSTPRVSGLKNLALLASGSVLGYNMTRDSSPTESQNNTGNQGMSGLEGAAAGAAGLYGLNKVGNYVASKVPTGGNTTSFNEKAVRFVEKTPKGGTGFKSAKDMKLADTLEKLRKLYIKLASKPGGVSKLMAKLLARFGISAFLKISVFLTSIAAAPKTAGLSLVITAISYGLWASLIYEVYKFLVGEESAENSSPAAASNSNEEQEKSSLISRLMNDSGGIRIDANVTPDYYNMMGVNPPTSSPSSVSSPSMRSTYSGGGDEVDRVLNSIKGVESSGGDYNAKNPNSTASGAYQFIDSTWRASTKKYGIGQQYPTARSAPPEIQDAVARKSVEELMAKYNGDTDKVANVWYTGNPNGNMTAAGLAANRGFTSEKYRAKFQSFQNNSGGSLNQSSNAMLNSRNAGSSSPIVFAPNTTNNNVGGNNGGTLSLPSSGVTDIEFSKLLVERAIG
jgi:hypothetical protein